MKDGEACPIDYANASPDLSLASLQYYFPWAISSLAAWCLFCCVTGRHMAVNQTTRDFFEIGDSDLPYAEKLERYRALADDYFEVDAFETFKAEALPHLTEVTIDYVESPEFDDLLVHVARVEPADVQETIIERARGRVADWVSDQRAAVGRRRVEGRRQGPRGPRRPARAP